jgi:hypothetical protein
MSPRTVLSVVTITAAILALAASASAGMAYETSISISKKFPAFHGKLRSPYTYCTQNRKVRVYRVKNGPDKLLASGISESDGTWEARIGDRLTSGAYYSSVTAKHSAEIGVNCRAAKSKLVTVD